MGTPYVRQGPTPLTDKTLNLFVMKKVMKVVGTGLGLYLTGWFVLWFIAVMCGAPANLGEWYTGTRVLSGLFAVPLIAVGIVSTVNELNS
jgi:hypothetical protein